ncbi:hypothetical protein [Anaerotruncus sp.]|uniref:hypothetical protein n=1 Tax=Anaerotruncus sp. TaxID=1872531 RepID=UPI0025BB443E|nr:hypothetical protein [Anaerotruncus sp.]
MEHNIPSTAERSNHIVHYIIQVYQDGVLQYLFNTRMLVQDVSLAKLFSAPALAKRYLSKSVFYKGNWSVVSIDENGVIRNTTATYMHGIMP